MISLAEENEELQAKVEQLESLLSDVLGPHFPPEWRLTPSQTRILALLIKRQWVSHQAMEDVVSYGRNLMAPREAARVHIYQIRRALKPLGIKVETLHCMGYKIDEPARRRLKTLALTPT